MLSNTAQLPTISGQVAEARRKAARLENQNLVFNSARSRRKKGEKKSKHAYWPNYIKAMIF